MHQSSIFFVGTFLIFFCFFYGGGLAGGAMRTAVTLRENNA